MSAHVVVIDDHRVELHEPFMRFIARVFPSISFRRWYELGGWDAGYRAFAIFEGDAIVANASLQRMHLVIDGRRQTGWQLGAVGVLPDHRGRGLQRLLIPHVLNETTADDPLLLFANEDVLEFYPRFGFRQVREWMFEAEHAVRPGDGALRRMSLDDPTDRALLKRIAATAQPATQRFGARDYGGILLWHWTNGHERAFYFHADDDAIVIAEQDMEVLRILDVLAQEPIALESYLPQLVNEPVDYLEFGFSPEHLWPSAVPAFEYLESPLFVSGPIELPRAPFKFPMLAQT